MQTRLFAHDIDLALLTSFIQLRNKNHELCRSLCYQTDVYVSFISSFFPYDTVSLD